jgi:uncharacterized membrane protein YhhN
MALAAGYWLSLLLFPFPGHWVLKFTPMLVAAVVLAATLELRLAAVMAIGFIAAAAGDLFLALHRQDYFIQGLSCFLITQIAYSIAFIDQSKGLLRRWPYWLPIPIVAAGVFFLAYPHLADHLLPVTVYALALIVMTVSASLAEARPGRIYFGALLFLLSDALIGIDRFVWSFDHALLIIIATYFFAQYLIFTGSLQAFPKRRQG